MSTEGGRPRSKITQFLGVDLHSTGIGGSGGGIIAHRCGAGDRSSARVGSQVATRCGDTVNSCRGKIRVRKRVTNCVLKAKQ